MVFWTRPVQLAHEQRVTPLYQDLWLKVTHNNKLVYNYIFLQCHLARHKYILNYYLE